MTAKVGPATLVRFPPELHARLKRAAARRRVPMAELLREAATAWLDAQGEPDVYLYDPNQPGLPLGDGGGVVEAIVDAIREAAAG